MWMREGFRNGLWAGVLLLGLGSAPAQAKKALLKPVFQAGQIYRYSSTTEVTMRLPTETGAETAERRVTMEQIARLEVRTGTTEGEVEITASTEALKVHISGGGETLAFDSTDKTTPPTPLGAHFAAAEHRRLRLLLGTDGKVRRAEEFGDAAPVSVIAGLPQFGPDELKQIILSAVAPFSTDAVEEGDRWKLKGRRSLGDLGEMDFNLSYRFADTAFDEGEKCAVVTFTGGLTGDLAVGGEAPASPEEKSPPAKGPNLGITSQKIEGRLHFDLKHRVVRASEQTVALTVQTPDSSRPDGKMPLQVEQKLTLKLLSLEPFEPAS